MLLLLRPHFVSGDSSGTTPSDPGWIGLPWHIIGRQSKKQKKRPLKSYKKNNLLKNPEQISRVEDTPLSELSTHLQLLMASELDLRELQLQHLKYVEAIEAALNAASARRSQRLIEEGIQYLVRAREEERRLADEALLIDQELQIARAEMQKLEDGIITMLLLELF